MKHKPYHLWEFPIPVAKFRSHVDLMTSRFSFDVLCSYDTVTRTGPYTGNADYLNEVIADKVVDGGYTLEDIAYEFAGTVRYKKEKYLIVRATGSASDWLDYAEKINSE